jgi:hypothetical protein
MPDTEYQMRFNETVNNLTRNKIDEKMNNRESKTIVVRRSMEKYKNLDKENLQAEIESKPVFYQNMKDSVVERARVKSKIKEKVINNNLEIFTNKEQPEKIKYYETYVK